MAAALFLFLPRQPKPPPTQAKALVMSTHRAKKARRQAVQPLCTWRNFVNDRFSPARQRKCAREGKPANTGRAGQANFTTGQAPKQAQ